MLPTDEPIFLGVHSYDMAAVGRLDYNFTVGHPEKNYLARREGAVFVGVSFEPDAYHFAGSVGIRPEDGSGCDVFLTKCLDGYVVEVLTRTGRNLVEDFDMPAHDAGRPATGNYQQHIYLPQAKLGEVMEKSYDNPVWEETAAKCVGCGTCNIVCPTCYCFNVEENVDISVTKGSRERHWDGCMLRKFSEVAGGEVFREDLAARQRHRVFRKFKYISDQTGQPWCVGCGRCTAYCTADISIVSIVNHLERSLGKDEYSATRRDWLISLCMAIRDRLAEHTRENPAQGVAVKIGLNSGEPITEDNDLFGSTVQLAARIAEAADARVEATTLAELDFLLAAIDRDRYELSDLDLDDDETRALQVAMAATRPGSTSVSVSVHPTTSSASSAPTVAPGPRTVLTTPGGNPEPTASSVMRSLNSPPWKHVRWASWIS